MCGKRAIDKDVVRILDDRSNSISMSKLARILQKGHDEWYADRRGLYQAVLYNAHASTSTSSSILPLVKAEGSYTPPIPQTPLPCAQVLRRAQLH